MRSMVVDLEAIEAALRRMPYLHAYELGDLDPREAPHCTWLASPRYDAIALIYHRLATPTLVAFTDGELAPLQALLASHVHTLPPRFYAHLTPGVETALAPGFELQLLGHNRKMALVRRVEPPAAAIHWLTADDTDELCRFYPEAYPGNFFEPSSLTRGPYVAVRDARGLAAVAGVHVYSRLKRVATLGSIATRADARGRGHAGAVTSALCHRLQDELDTIALNVRADNAAAIACYRRVGFEPCQPYDEWMVRSIGNAETPLVR